MSVMNSDSLSKTSIIGKDKPVGLAITPNPTVGKTNILLRCGVSSENKGISSLSNYTSYSVLSVDLRVRLPVVDGSS